MAPVDDNDAGLLSDETSSEMHLTGRAITLCV